MGMSEFFGKADDANSTALLHHALDVGMNFFDTADMYGPWTNERLVGAALRARRDQAVIATKFGVVRDENRDVLGLDGKPEYVRTFCDASLERLGLETNDVYYQHRVPRPRAHGALDGRRQGHHPRAAGPGVAAPPGGAHRLHPRHHKADPLR